MDIGEITARTPLVRMLLPMAVGISMAWAVQSFVLFYVCIGITSAIIAISVVMTVRHHQSNWLFFASIFSVMLTFSLGNALFQYSLPDNLSDDADIAFAEVKSVSDNESSMSIIAYVYSAVDSVGNAVDIDPQNVVLYIQGNDYSIYEGKVISFAPLLKPVSNMGNPVEFNYCRYLRCRKVYRQQFLKRDQYKIVRYNSSVSASLADIRRVITRRIYSLPFSPESKDFLNQIILGQGTGVDDDIRQSFANVGLAHILALSGLHIGIITLILSLLLAPLDYLRLRKLRLCLTIVFLLFYAALTGMSASVSRAVIMSTVTFIAFLVYRRNTPVNTLFLAAVLVLAISPFDLFDVGFQLSFMAVLFILIANSLARKYFAKQSKIAYWFTNLVLMSAASMIGTGILSAFYFNVIPIVFLLSNAVIVPLMPIVVSVGVVSILVGSDVLCAAFSTGFDWALYFVRFVETLPFSYSANVYVSIIDVVIYYIFIAAAIVALYKSRKALSAIFVSGIILYFTLESTVKPAHSGAMILNDFNETPILLYDKGRSMLFPVVDSDYRTQFSIYHKKLLAVLSIDSLSETDDKLARIYRVEPTAFMANCSTVIVLDRYLPKPTVSVTLTKCDALVITKNFHGSIKRVLDYYSPRSVILSGNILPDRREQLLSQLKAIRMPYFDINASGAYIF